MVVDRVLRRLRGRPPRPLDHGLDTHLLGTAATLDPKQARDPDASERTVPQRAISKDAFASQARVASVAASLPSISRIGYLSHS